MGNDGPAINQTDLMKTKRLPSLIKIFSMSSIKHIRGKPFILSVRILSLLPVIPFMDFCYNGAGLAERAIRTHSIYKFARCSAFAIILSFGLYFITTKQAKHHRILSTLLYLPALAIPPSLTIYFTDNLLIILASPILSVLIYYRLNPWRRTEDES